MGHFVVKSQPSGRGLHQGSTNLSYRRPDSECFRVGLSSNHCSLNSAEAAVDHIATNESGCVPIKLYLYKQERTRFGPQASLPTSIPHGKLHKTTAYAKGVKLKCIQGHAGNTETGSRLGLIELGSCKNQCCHTLPVFSRKPEMQIVSNF